MKMTLFALTRSWCELGWRRRTRSADSDEMLGLAGRIADGSDALPTSGRGGTREPPTDGTSDLELP